MHKFYYFFPQFFPCPTAGGGEGAAVCDGQLTVS